MQPQRRSRDFRSSSTSRQVPVGEVHDFASRLDPRGDSNS